MFALHVLQVGILLVVRKRDAQNIGLGRDVVKQRAASQLDIIGMRAEDKDSFAGEVHLLIQNRVRPHGKSAKRFNLDWRGMKSKA